MTKNFLLNQKQNLMQTLLSPKIAWRQWLWLFYLWSMATFAQAQIISFNDCATADAALAADILNLTDGDILNQTFTVLGTGAGNGYSATPNPGCVTGAQQDAWVRFDTDVSRQVVFEYTPTTGQDAALVIYASNTDCAGLALMRCASLTGINNTETITINVIANTRYYVRVINLTDINDMAGVMSVYKGPRVLGDLCQNATEVSIGTCNFNYNVDASFFNNEGKANPVCATPEIDSWLRFEAVAGQRVGIEYTSTGFSASSLDAAIAVYDGTCGNLIERACANNVAGGEKEFFEYQVTTTGTQYIRVMNVENNETLTGSVCIYEVFTRETCAVLGTDLGASAISPLPLGSCGIDVNIFNTSGAPVSSDCIGTVAVSRDVWIPFRSATSERVLLEYSSITFSNIGISIYDATTIDCGASPTSIPQGCLANANANTITLEFDAVAGTTYYIQIVSVDNTASQGTLCLYPANKKAEDNFFTANSYAIDNSDCGVQFNVLADFNSTGRASIANADQANCAILQPVRADAWASFTTPTPLGTLTEIVVEYDNNNQDAADASDVALLIFTGNEINNITPTPAALINPIAPGAGNEIAFDTFYEDITIAASGGEVFARFEVITAGFYTVVGEAGDALDVFVTDDAFNPITGPFTQDNGFATYTAEFTPGVYYVQVFNGTAAPITDARIAVLSPLTQVACVNTTTEGIESFRIAGANLTPDTKYYVRIANIEPNDINIPTATQTVAGRLCIRDGNVADNDLCSTARSLVVGDCNIEFNLDNDLTILQPEAGVLYPATACLGGKTVQRDAWASFSAISTKTTIEFLDLTGGGRDAAIAVYRGACGGLIPVETTCGSYFVDDTDPAQRLESISVNTIIGNTYYIQVLNVGTPGDMDGRLCVFNTTERDVCDDSDLVNLVADACNIRMNVPATFTNTGINFDADTPEMLATYTAPIERNTCGLTDIDFASLGARDAWVRYIGNGDLVTIQYENQEATSNPALLLYTALVGPGPVDCGTGINGAGNPLNQFACANAVNSASIQTESITFQSVAGQLYILRVLDLAPTSMQGTLCIFSGERAPAVACDAVEVDIRSIIGEDTDIGACNVQFNVLSSNTDCGALAPECGVPALDCQSVAWATFTTGAGSSVARFPLPDNVMTVQYDNTTNSSVNPVDISLEIYRADPDCNTLVFVGCSDDYANANLERIEQVSFTLPDINASTTYFIRVISKSTDRTAFGKLCIFYGETFARPTCDLSLDYGTPNGVWRDFKVERTWTDRTIGTSFTDPVPCAVAGGSNPKAPNPPIVTNGWMKYEVPIGSTLEAITVQFDNTEYASTNQNSENAALAVYVQNIGPTIDDPTDCNLANLTPVSCANNVWRGTESLTVGVVPGATYFIRVMNVYNNNKDLPGRVRIFEFVNCDLGEELVVDGGFNGWGPIEIANPDVDPSNPTNTITSWYDMNTWEFNNNNPQIENYRRTPTLAQLPRQINSYARFATDYGYLIDNSNNNGAVDRNSFDRLRRKKGEFNPEGRYAVSQQAFTRKDGGFGKWDFYGYGRGIVGGEFVAYTGYGGHTYNNYCSQGDATPFREEPCTGFGQYESNLPALVPHTADANYMMLNGWWKRDGNTDPGKAWCETMDVSSTAGTTRYYVFTAWFQNLIGAGRNIDVPQLRVTICDMAAPNDPEVINPIDLVTAGDLPAPLDGFSSKLPGVTFTPAASNPNNLTYHFPEPPNNANVKKASPLGYTFGAASPCNIPGEPNNARVKALGSDFLVPESPDEWLVVRCIYRAPQDVEHFNLCIENLSLTKNGNDFAIDDISMRQCITTNTDALDNLLRGDACELSDDPAVLGIPLAVRMLDFSGKLLDDRVSLTWTTISEGNLSHFEIQRSTNGSDFVAIGRVDAKGAEQALASYQFTDSELPVGQRKLHYRLRMIDRNGYPELSNVITVNIEELNTIKLKLYPNPASSQDEVALEFQGTAGKAQVTVSDLMGTHLKGQFFDTTEGVNQLKLSTRGLATGIYIIKLQNGNRQASKKLVVSY